MTFPSIARRGRPCKFFNMGITCVMGSTSLLKRSLYQSRKGLRNLRHLLKCIGGVRESDGIAQYCGKGMIQSQTSHLNTGRLCVGELPEPRSTAARAQFSCSIRFDDVAPHNAKAIGRSTIHSDHRRMGSPRHPSS